MCREAIATFGIGPMGSLFAFAQGHPRAFDESNCSIKLLCGHDEATDLAEQFIMRNQDTKMCIYRRNVWTTSPRVQKVSPEKVMDSGDV